MLMMAKMNNILLIQLNAIAGFSTMIATAAQSRGGKGQFLQQLLQNYDCYGMLLQPHLSELKSLQVIMKNHQAWSLHLLHPDF